VHNSPNIYTPRSQIMNGGKKLLGFHLQLGNGTMHASVIPTMQIGMGGGRQMARHPGLHNTHTHRVIFMRRMATPQIH
jgi:hypothetical protein